MTNSHNSSPAYYHAAEALDLAAEFAFGHDWEDRATDPEARTLVAEQDVADAEDFVVQGGYGWARIVDPAYG